jgi:hypothetical protein
MTIESGNRRLLQSGPDNLTAFSRRTIFTGIVGTAVGFLGHTTIALFLESEAAQKAAGIYPSLPQNQLNKSRDTLTSVQTALNEIRLKNGDAASLRRVVNDSSFDEATSILSQQKEITRRQGLKIGEYLEEDKLLFDLSRWNIAWLSAGVSMIGFLGSVLVSTLDTVNQRRSQNSLTDGKSAIVSPQ